MLVHIFNQAVLERSNCRVTQKERGLNFKAKISRHSGRVKHWVYTNTKIFSLSFDRSSFPFSFLFLFWNSLIAFVKKKCSFNSHVKMDCYWYLKMWKIVWFNWNIFAICQTDQTTILKPCKRDSLVL